MSYLLCSVLLPALSPLCRFTIEATHDNDEHYTYLVGVCVNPDPVNSDSECGIVQYNTTNPSNRHCVGKVSTAQVSRSKYYIVAVNIKAISHITHL